MLLLENNPLQGDNSNNASSQAVSHHHSVDYFPITACYFLHISFKTRMPCHVCVWYLSHCITVLPVEEQVFFFHIEIFQYCIWHDNNDAAVVICCRLCHFPYHFPPFLISDWKPVIQNNVLCTLQYKRLPAKQRLQGLGRALKSSLVIISDLSWRNVFALHRVHPSKAASSGCLAICQEKVSSLERREPW